MGGIWEASERHLRVMWETLGRCHLGVIWEISGRHLGGIGELSEVPRATFFRLDVSEATYTISTSGTQPLTVQAVTEAHGIEN